MARDRFIRNNERTRVVAEAVEGERYGYAAAEATNARSNDSGSSAFSRGTRMVTCSRVCAGASKGTSLTSKRTRARSCNRCS
jgi:hypothetical protein